MHGVWGAVDCATVTDVPVVAVLEAVLIGLLTSQISFVVTTVYLHRALAHKAITLRPPVAFACRFVIWMSTGTRPRQWVAVHRKHHAHTDKEGDPHSPVIFGYSLVQFGNAVLYRRVSKNRRAGGPLRQGSPRGPLGQGAVQPRPPGTGARRRRS